MAIMDSKVDVAAKAQQLPHQP